MRISDPDRAQVLTVAEMRAAEQALIDAGVSVDELMQRAGRGAAEWVRRMAVGRAVTVLCGPGNNGGDGYVIAETLRSAGQDVAVVAPIEPATDAAKRARKRFSGEIFDGDDRRGAVFVDCLFGSGLDRSISEGLAETIGRLHDEHDLSVAIDLPSNVSSDGGGLLGPVPRYDCTIALGSWKFAHALMPSLACMGALRLVDIGVESGTGNARMLGRPAISAPPADAHKYTRGYLGVIGGAMLGASILASEAAMRSGAGYVKLFATHSHPAAPADLVIEENPLEDWLDDDRYDALLAGPGLGRDEEARDWLGAVLRRDLPTVLDADALMLLSPEQLTARDAPLIVTPHEGELGRLEKAFGLRGKGTKLERSRRLASALRAVVVAKGADTLIAAPDGKIVLAGRTSSWLSTAGTGDVLAGIIASRLATGASALDAVEQAVAIHAEAADLAGPAFTAGELVETLPQALAMFL